MLVASAIQLVHDDGRLLVATVDETVELITPK
jgi:hypothetical protein